MVAEVIGQKFVIDTGDNASQVLDWLQQCQERGKPYVEIVPQRGRWVKVKASTGHMGDCVIRGQIKARVRWWLLGGVRCGAISQQLSSIVLSGVPNDEAEATAATLYDLLAGGSLPDDLCRTLEFYGDEPEAEPEPDPCGIIDRGKFADLRLKLPRKWELVGLTRSRLKWMFNQMRFCGSLHMERRALVVEGVRVADAERYLEGLQQVVCGGDLPDWVSHVYEWRGPETDTEPDDQEAA